MGVLLITFVCSTFGVFKGGCVGGLKGKRENDVLLGNVNMDSSP